MNYKMPKKAKNNKPKKKEPKPIQPPPKFGELTHNVPAIAQESKKVKEKDVFAK